MPDDINPVHYQVDEKTGEADADTFYLKNLKKLNYRQKKCIIVSCMKIIVLKYMEAHQLCIREWIYMLKTSL